MGLNTTCTFKGWSLYFRYDRTKNKQVLIFEDTISASYVTYQLLRGDVVGEFSYIGDLTRVRNIVSVVYKDQNDSNKVKQENLKMRIQYLDIEKTD